MLSILVLEKNRQKSFWDLDSPTPPGAGERLVDSGMPRGAERYRPFAVAREWHLFLFLGVIAKLLKYGTYRIYRI
jgi:hypothetical protein